MSKVVQKPCLHRPRKCVEKRGSNNRHSHGNRSLGRSPQWGPGTELSPGAKPPKAKTLVTFESSTVGQNIYLIFGILQAATVSHYNTKKTRI